MINRKKTIAIGDTDAVATFVAINDMAQKKQAIMIIMIVESLFVSIYS